MGVTGSGRVRVSQGVIVGDGGGRTLSADVYTPPEGNANGAGVLLIHGGGWANGDRSQLRGYGILLGRMGYTSVACEYRLSGEAKWPAQIHDVKAALRWMRANAGTLGIDPANIAVSGNSAGGHLALIVAGTPHIAAFEGDGGNAGVATDVAAAIAFYAPTMLARPGGALSEVVRFLLGPDASETRVAEASPITYAHAGFPPTMLLTGNKDELVPEEASLRMYAALSEAGARAELHVYDGAPHAFDAIPEFGRQCASLMTLFLDRNVVRPRAVSLRGASPAG